MPSGRRHTIATVVIASSAFSALFLNSPGNAFWCATGTLTGIMLSPDLDVDSGNISVHYMRSCLGAPASHLWRMFFWPYSRLFKHRSYWSHAPVISTVIRLAYCGVLLFPVWYFLKLPLIEFRPWMGWWLIGLIASDTAHFILDFADSKLGGRL